MKQLGVVPLLPSVSHPIHPLSLPTLEAESDWPFRNLRLFSAWMTTNVTSASNYPNYDGCLLGTEEGWYLPTNIRELGSTSQVGAQPLCGWR